MIQEGIRSSLTPANGKLLALFKHVQDQGDTYFCKVLSLNSSNSWEVQPCNLVLLFTPWFCLVWLYRMCLLSQMAALNSLLIFLSPCYSSYFSLLSSAFFSPLHLAPNTLLNCSLKTRISVRFLHCHIPSFWKNAWHVTDAE